MHELQYLATRIATVGAHNVALAEEKLKLCKENQKLQECAKQMLKWPATQF